jgi:uncharacterized protein YigA (DUF484 family)
MLEATILENLQQLPESLQQDVLHYIQSLLRQQSAQHSPETIHPSRQQAFGVWQGKVRMSEDFDTPLDDLSDSCCPSHES